MANTSLNTTSFHINGFWFHVSWDAQGKVGRDQHNNLWYNKANPRSEMGGMRPSSYRTSNPSFSSNKDTFLYEREARFEAYRNR